MRTVDLRMTLGGAVRVAQCDRCWALVPIDDAEKHAAVCEPVGETTVVVPESVVPRKRTR